jgi:hypothetical protein
MSGGQAALRVVVYSGTRRLWWRRLVVYVAARVAWWAWDVAAWAREDQR